MAAHRVVERRRTFVALFVDWCPAAKCCWGGFCFVFGREIFDFQKHALRMRLCTHIKTRVPSPTDGPYPPRTTLPFDRNDDNAKAFVPAATSQRFIVSLCAAVVQRPYFFGIRVNHS